MNYGAPVDTSTVGPHTLTLTATDGAGNTITTIGHYNVVPPSPVLTFNIDAGATLTPVDPTYDAPITTGAAQGLSGSYSVQRLAWSYTPGVHEFSISSLHFETTTGATYDLWPNSNGTLTCNDSTNECRASIAVGANNTGSDLEPVFIEVSQLAPKGPRLEGNLANPTGFDWAPANPSIPDGVAMKTSDGRLRELLRFHATPCRW